MKMILKITARDGEEIQSFESERGQRERTHSDSKSWITLPFRAAAFRMILHTLLFLIPAPSLLAIEISKTQYSLAFDRDSTYQVFDDGPSQAQIVFEWKGLPMPISTRYGLTISTSTLNLISSSLEKLQYQILSPITHMEVILFNGSNFKESLLWYSQPVKQKDLSISMDISIASGQIVSPGTYRATLDLGLYDEQEKQIGYYPISLTATVAASIFVDVSTNGAPMGSIKNTLDFGEVSTETMRTASLRVRSNTPYSLSISSLNGGNLVLSPSWKRHGHKYQPIDYDVRYLKTTINPQQTSTQMATGTMTPLEGIIYPMTITTYPDPSKHWEGEYSDELIFSTELSN